MNTRPNPIPPRLFLAASALLLTTALGCFSEPDCEPAPTCRLRAPTEGSAVWSVGAQGDRVDELTGSELGGGCWIDPGPARPQPNGIIDPTVALACAFKDGLTGAYWHLGDLRNWAEGEHIFKGSELQLALVADHPCNSPQLCQMCVAQLDFTEVKLVVEEAVGGADPSRPEGVTEDYRREFSIEFNSGKVPSHRDYEDRCPDLSMNAKVRFVQEAKDFTVGSICR